MKILLADLHRIYGYSGGIESVLAHMAGAFCARGHEVIVVFADEKAKGECFFSFPVIPRSRKRRDGNSFAKSCVLFPA